MSRSTNMERSKLVERLRGNLEGYGWPRVQLFLIVSLAGLAAFIVSYALLAAGLTAMAVRYGAAATAGYLAFLALIAVWLAWKRHQPGDFDPIDLIDVPGPRGGGSGIDSFAGGRSGGGGASAAWGEPSASSGSDSGSWIDADDLGWVLVAIAVVLAGLLAVFYVVWIAPALLAEVLVDAAIVSAVSHRVTQLERRDWTATVLRRTWLPALILIVTVTAAGYALQRAAPDARSIGPAVETILNR